MYERHRDSYVVKLCRVGPISGIATDLENKRKLRQVFSLIRDYAKKSHFESFHFIFAGRLEERNISLVVPYRRVCTNLHLDEIYIRLVYFKTV